MSEHSAGGGGLSIGAGLIAMWIAYPITNSIWAAWAAFFVVGGIAFYTLAAASDR